MACHLKKKMKNDIRSVRHPFDELPEDFKIDILRRLPTESVAGFACVSKSWLRLITTYSFPKDHHLKPFFCWTPPIWTHSHVEVQLIFCSTHMVVSLPLPKRAFDALQLRVNHQTSCLDCCNGLTLFCHPINMDAVAARLERLYSYYVFDVFSHQRATIHNPVNTALPMDVVLAFDPSKSSFYLLNLIRVPNV